MEDIIVVEHAIKQFKKVVAVNDVSVRFEKGKIHGIIGRNGSGKTVLFKCICGFMPLSNGEIFVQGKQVGKEVGIPPNLGIIIESPGFLPNYSGFKNLYLLSRIQGKINKEKIKETMGWVGLDPDNKKHVSKYSLGMRQRLGIAQAIMEDPDILILDEPMNGLDNRGVEDMRKFFLTLKEKGKTIVLASHNKEDIDVLCDSVHEMDGGNISFIR